uniref:LPD38 domain-containing protein n=1 Tax=Rheinheimera sp. TaxID=1869214 RepID=UPI004048031B
MSYFDRSKYLLNLPATEYATPTANTPQAKPANNQGRIGDTIDALQMGAYKGTAGIIDMAGTLTGSNFVKNIAQKFYGWGDDQLNQMSERGRTAFQQQIFEQGEDGGFTLGAGATNFDTWLLNIANGLGQFAPIVAGGGGAGLAARAAGAAKGVQSAVTTRGYVAAGGSMATGMGGNEARKEVKAMPQEVLDAAPIYQNLVDGISQKKPDLSEQEVKDRARNALAEQLAKEAMTDPKALLANFGMSAISDPILGRALMGARLGKGFLGSVGKGALVEAPTEFVQGGTQALVNNEVLSQIDGRDIWDGVLIGAANEAVIGGAVGGTIGGATYPFGRNQDDKKDQPPPSNTGSPIAPGNAPVVNPDPAMNLPPQMQQTLNAQPLTGNYADPTATGAMVAMDPAVQMLANTNPALASELNQLDQKSAQRSAQITGLLSGAAATAPTGNYADPTATGAMVTPEPVVNTNINPAPQDPSAPALNEAQQALTQGMIDSLENDSQADTTTDLTTVTPNQTATPLDTVSPNATTQYARPIDAPAADLSDMPNIDGVYVKMSDGKPFQSPKEALASKSAREAKKAGNQIEAVPFADGYGWQVVAPNISEQAPNISQATDTNVGTTLSEQLPSLNGERKLDYSQTDKKGNISTYYSNTKEKDGVTTTTFTFNRSDKGREQRNKASVPVDVALGGKYEIDTDSVGKEAKIVKVNEVRESQSNAAATVVFELDGDTFDGEVRLIPKQQSNSDQAVVTPSPEADISRTDGSTSTVDEKGLTLLHGSPKATMNINDVQIIRTGQKQGKSGRSYGGFYATSEADIEQAKHYANMGDGVPTVYNINVKPGTKVLNKTGDITRLSETYIDELKSQGYGLVVGKDPRGKIEYVVIDKNVISDIKARETDKAPQAVQEAQAMPANQSTQNFEQLEDALISERENTSTEIENGYESGESLKRRERTELERAIYDATVASTLDPDNADLIVDVALSSGRLDLADYAAKRAERYANAMGTEPGVPKSSPKYDQIKQNLEKAKRDAIEKAKKLREKILSAQEAQAMPAPEPAAEVEQQAKPTNQTPEQSGVSVSEDAESEVKAAESKAVSRATGIIGAKAGDTIRIDGNIGYADSGDYYIEQINNDGTVFISNDQGTTNLTVSDLVAAQRRGEVKFTKLASEQTKKKTAEKKPAEPAVRTEPDAITGEYAHTLHSDVTATVSKTDKGYSIDWGEGDVQQFTGKAAADKVQAALKREQYSKPDTDKGEMLFSKANYDTNRNQRAKGVPVPQVERMAQQFMKRMNGGAGIKVVVLRDQKEAELAFNQSLSGSIVRGAYNDATKTAYLIASNFDSIEHARRTLAHEVIAHGGLQSVIGAKTYRDFLTRINATRTRASFRPAWNGIMRDYGNLTPEKQAEEFFARWVEDQPESGSLKYWWQALVRWLNNQLAKVGITRAENNDVAAMRDMLDSIVQGFKSGRAPRRQQGKAVAFDRGVKYLNPLKQEEQEYIYKQLDSLIDDNGNLVDDYSSLKYDFEDSLSDEKLDDFNSFDQVTKMQVTLNDPNFDKALKAFENKVFFHGTPARDLELSDLEASGGGLFITSNRDTADHYSADDGKVFELKIKPINPFFIESSESTFDMEGTGILESLKEQGFDSVIPLDDGDVVVLDVGIIEAISSESDLQFSRTATADTRTAKEKLGLGEQADETLKEKATARYRETADTLKSTKFWQRLNEGIFDGMAGIKQAEDSVGITDPNRQGYVSARLASGLADVLHGVFNYGAPEWRNGVVARKADTKGLLEVFSSLGDDLNNWLAWMGANRAEKLMAEGRENNLTADDIAELKALAAGKEQQFESVRQEYNKINSAIIDLAQQAGLISDAQRSGFDEEWYVPFFRDMDVDPEMQGIAAMVHGPKSKNGIANQNAQLKELKGGAQSTKDLLENIIQRQSTLIDAALKNNAMLEIVGNLSGTDYMQPVTSPEIAALSQTELNLLSKVKVMRDGKPEAYAVSDPALLRGLLQINDAGSKSLFNRLGRSAKRFLTAGITLSPDFIVKNFVRDAAHAWMVNKDDFKFGADSIKGLRKAFKEDEAYRDLIFSGAAFQGGYVHGADPEAAAQQVRRALKAKGLTVNEVNSYMDSLVTKGSQLLERYRNASDKVENANRLSTYEAALAAGKSARQAAFEAKDLMDYSLKGNFALIGSMIDFLPFFNARLQGLSKLVRAAKAGDGDRVLKVLSANLAMKGMYVAGFSLALAYMNDDDERYQELADWDKDANWHFFLGEDHFRIPKPFELGIIFGTFPERMLHLGSGTQPASDLGKAVGHAVFNTLALNPIPQLALPAVEVMVNRSFFQGKEIEGMADENRRPEDRYNAYTSEVAKQLGQLFNVSPKKIEHLVKGYTGTIGGYMLGASDIVARQMLGIESADTPISRYPVVKAFYQGDAPKTNTKFQQEFYDALNAAGQAYGSYKRAAEEGNTERQQALLEDNSDKLRSRVQLNRLQRQLSELNKQAERVNNNSALTGAQKREQLDAITRRKNAVYQAAYVRFNLGEW